MTSYLGVFVFGCGHLLGWYVRIQGNLSQVHGSETQGATNVQPVFNLWVDLGQCLHASVSPSEK